MERRHLAGWVMERRHLVGWVMERRHLAGWVMERRHLAGWVMERRHLAGFALIHSLRMDSNKETLAVALGRIPSGLFIVTVRSGSERTAFLASWVQQCAFEPPMLSVGVKCGRPADALLQPGALLTVNILRSGDSSLMKPFARGIAPGADPYVGVPTEGPQQGAEILPAALASLDARVQARAAAGDHILILAEVLAGRVHGDGGEPWVHVRKNGLNY